MTSKLHVRIRTRSDDIYDGTLIGGSFMVNGLKISASEVVSCSLTSEPGRIELRDGTSLTVHQSLKGWFLQKRSFNITGRLSLHVVSLDREIEIQAADIEKLYIKAVE